MLTNKQERKQQKTFEKATYFSFMDTFQDEAEDQVEKKRTRSDSWSLSKYEQLREKNIAEIQNLRNELFPDF